jgi:hypothetical protein
MMTVSGRSAVALLWVMLPSSYLPLGVDAVLSPSFRPDRSPRNAVEINRACGGSRSPR